VANCNYILQIITALWVILVYLFVQYGLLLEFENKKGAEKPRRKRRLSYFFVLGHSVRKILVEFLEGFVMVPGFPEKSAHAL